MLRSDHFHRTISSLFTSRKKTAFSHCADIDCNSVFSRTARGQLEATGRTRALPRDMRALLREIDGHCTAGEAQSRIEKYSDAKLLEVLNELVQGNFIRQLQPLAKYTPPSFQLSPPPACISPPYSTLPGEPNVRVEREKSQDKYGRKAILLSSFLGILAQVSNLRSAGAALSVRRQAIELSALVAAYLQYFYIDVQLQILSLPSITT